MLTRTASLRLVGAAGARALSRSTPALSESWNPMASRRSGVVARKLGMTSAFDDRGARHGLTVLKLEDVVVTQVKTEDSDGYTAVQLGAGVKKIKRTKKPQLGHFSACGREEAPPRVLQEFRVSEDALLTVGTKIFPSHFAAGQKVDVCGTTIGKGFQGPMKRWGFGGLHATHGVSKAHRSHGSTGQCQDPGRTFKGKKMAGRMGGKRRTQQNLEVFAVDEDNSLIMVKGHVPGAKNSTVRVTDAIKTLAHREDAIPPFPTFVLAEGAPVPTGTVVAKATGKDPMEFMEGLSDKGTKFVTV